MNKVIMMGRLTRDPEMRYSQGPEAKAIAKFSIAVDRRFKKANEEQTADFFNCTAFGKTAEFVENYLRKGTKILIDGEMRNNNYTNKSGEKIYGMDILINTIDFAESKNASQAAPAAPAPQAQAAPAAPADGFMNVPDDSDFLPFS